MAFTPLMEHIVKELAERHYCKSVCEFGNQRNHANPKLGTTKELYQHYGYEEYLSLDVNEEMDAQIADLNHPVDLGRTFDLVTNNGTGEHIFNQAAVFENAHNLSHKYIVHVLPFTPWINHGFYNFNPILFRDLAVANRYESNVFIANRNGQGVELSGDELFAEKRPKALEAAIDGLLSGFGRDVMVAAIYKKTDNKEFAYPFQGKYVSDITGELQYVNY
jgi:hypothetical protein